MNPPNDSLNRSPRWRRLALTLGVLEHSDQITVTRWEARMPEKSIIEAVIKNTPFAIIIAGVLLVLIGAAGGWPPSLQINGLGWQIFLAVTGLVVSGSGFALLWRERNMGAKSALENETLRLIVYSSDIQTTELRGTKDGLQLYISDLRPGKNSGVQGDVISVDRLRTILRQGDIRVYMDKDLPVFDIGPKKHWLYSKNLFGNPKRLQSEIYGLIERTVKFASE
jgi:hypothetical protein